MKCGNDLLNVVIYSFFFFQAEDGIRDLVRSRGLGDVYKRQLDALGQMYEIFNKVFRAPGSKFRPFITGLIM